MTTKKPLFSVSDRKKLAHCPCMKCAYPVCLMLDSKTCGLLESQKERTEGKK